MNLRRSLSNHQEYYLRQIALGRLIIVEPDTFEKYEPLQGGKPYPGVYVTTPPNGKPRGGRHILSGGHMYSSIVELRQRGILVLEEGRWVPNKVAQRQFGKLPQVTFPRPPLAMSRTRAARVQPPHQ